MKIKQLLLSLTDWELFKKPESTRLREEIINNIVLVDPKKWYHPRLPEGTVPFCGSFFGRSDEDVFKYKHPHLHAELYGGGSLTIVGKEKSLTKKDCKIIGEVFFSIKRGDKLNRNLLSTNRILLSRLFELLVVMLWFIFPLSFAVLLIYNFPFQSMTGIYGILIVAGLIKFIGFLEEKFS